MILWWTLLQQIASAFCAEELTRDAARSAVMDVFGRMKGLRISLRRFDGEPGALRLLCFASRARGHDRLTSQRDLPAQEYGACFDALMCSDRYASVDAMADANPAPVLQRRARCRTLPAGTRHRVWQTAPHSPVRLRRHES